MSERSNVRKTITARRKKPLYVDISGISVERREIFWFPFDLILRNMPLNPILKCTNERKMRSLAQNADFFDSIKKFVALCP